MKYITLNTETTSVRRLVGSIIKDAPYIIETRIKGEGYVSEWWKLPMDGSVENGNYTIFWEEMEFRLAIPEASPSEIPNSSPFDKDGWREFTGTEEVIEEGDQASARGQSATPELSGFTGGRERLTTTNSTLTITT